jgi:ABC-2 type transport system ATP-binding protein
MMNYPAMRTDGLFVRRGHRTVLHDLTLEVPRGEIVGLLGPSGSGKTTLMRAIAGSQRIAEGSVEVLGEPAGAPVLRRKVGYATQSGSVYDDLTVAQNLAYFGRVLGAPPGDVERVLLDIDLADAAKQLVGTLSGGQRSRVSLGVALLADPELLVLDEPTVGLDPVLRADLWGLFRRLADRGATLLVSSHVMDEARRCDRILLLRDGRLLVDDTPAGLLARTGTTDPEEAFLALAREANDAPTTHHRHRAPRAHADPARPEDDRAAAGRP